MVIASIQNWQGVNWFSKNFRQCDGGYIAEGVSSVVVRLLVENGKSTGQLGVMTNSVWTLSGIQTQDAGKPLPSTHSTQESCFPAQQKDGS